MPPPAGPKGGGPKGGGHAPTPLRTLRGHVQAVTAVALSTELGLAASGAADGTVLLHTPDPDPDPDSDPDPDPDPDPTPDPTPTSTPTPTPTPNPNQVLLHTCHNGALLRRLTHPDGQPVGHLLLNGLHCRLVVGAATAGEARLYLHSLSGVRLHCLQLPGGVRTAPATRTIPYSPWPYYTYTYTYTYTCCGLLWLYSLWPYFILPAITLARCAPCCSPPTVHCCSRAA